MYKFLASILALALCGPTAAIAQADYPIKPIRLVLPYPAGGATDGIARLVGDGMSRVLGQQIVIDNRPGAAGNIATDFVSKAAPDGYTLLLGFNTALTVTPGLSPNLTFDIKRDFIPITQLADGQYILVVNPAVPVKNVSELIDYAKKNPGSLNFSSGGMGSSHHLSAELFMAMTGTKMTHLPYKGGGPAAVAVLGNEAQMVVGSVATTVPHVQAGKMRAIAVTGLERFPGLPDVPTLDESGLKGFDVTTWYGLLAPARTPQPIIDKLQSAAATALKENAAKDGLALMGLRAIGNSGSDFGALIDRETATWSKVLKDSGVKLQ